MDMIEIKMRRRPEMGGLNVDQFSPEDEMRK